MIHYNKIAIEGNIGSGKSTLTDILAQKLDYKAIYESFEDNLLLKEFYKKGITELYALEESMLRSRLNSLDIANWNSSDKIISDFWLQKSLFFAHINLNSKDLIRKFLHEFEILNQKIEPPDLVIYLKSEPSKVLDRIKKRGRIMEQEIDSKYLEKIHIQYQKTFNENSSIPILEINTHEFNFMKTDKDLDLLLSFLTQKSKKSYTILLK